MRLRTPANGSRAGVFESERSESCAVRRYEAVQRRRTEIIGKLRAHVHHIVRQRVLAVEVLVVRQVVDPLHRLQRARVAKHFAHLAEQVIVVTPAEVPRLAALRDFPAHILRRAVDDRVPTVLEVRHDLRADARECQDLGARSRWKN